MLGLCVSYCGERERGWWRGCARAWWVVAMRLWDAWLMLDLTVERREDN